jgi:hypothetical protein
MQAATHKSYSGLEVVYRGKLIIAAGRCETFAFLGSAGGAVWIDAGLQGKIRCVLVCVQVSIMSVYVAAFYTMSARE